MWDNVIDIASYIILLAYTLISIYVVAKEFFSDLKKPFLGIASTYIFNYFIFDLMMILVFCFGITIYKNGIVSSRTLTFSFLVQIISLYNGALFIMKKFVFSNIKKEIELTALLQICLYVSIAIILIVPKSSAPIFHSHETTFTRWILCTQSAFSSLFFKFSHFCFVVRFIPITLLLVLWAYSISKKYNKLDLNYFTKSANLSILTFLSFETLQMITPIIVPRNHIEEFIILLYLLSFKFIFNISMMKWLRNKDMEDIEINAILRSKRHA